MRALSKRTTTGFPSPFSENPASLPSDWLCPKQKKTVYVIEGDGQSRRDALAQIITLLKTNTKDTEQTMLNMFGIQDDITTKPSRTWAMPVTVTKGNIATAADTILQHAGIRYIHNGSVSTPGFIFPEEACKAHPELLHVRIKRSNSYSDFAALTDDKDGLNRMAEKITANIFCNTMSFQDAYDVECKVRDTSDLAKPVKNWSHHLTAGYKTHNTHAQNILRNIGFSVRPETGTWHWELPERVKS